MQFDEFVEKVKQRADMSSGIDAVNAIRATLVTLGERLHGGETGDLAAQLPREIGTYLLYPGEDEGYTLKEFYTRVVELEEINYAVAIDHAHAVMETVSEAVTAGEIEDVLEQLPDEYEELFTSKSD